MTRQLFLRAFDNDKTKFPPMPSDKKIVIGRSPDCDINLSQYFSHSLQSISRQHLSIYFETDHFMIVDLSRNGTWLNTFKLPTQVSKPLADGDIIKLNEQIQFQVTIQAASDETEPIPVEDNLSVVLNHIRNRHHLLILGMAGSGKTTLLRKLTQYLGDFFPDHQDFLFCYIGCEAIGDDDTVSFFRLLIGSIKEQVRQNSLELDDAYDQLCQPHSSPEQIQLAFAQAVHYIDQTHNKQLVFLLDQFDDVYQRLPYDVFQHLKEANLLTPKPIYIIAAQNDIRQDPQLDQFSRDIKDVYWLKLFTAAELNDIDRLSTLSAEKRSLAKQLGSKQPRLTELIAIYLDNMTTLPNTETDVISSILSDVLVQRHCQKMWESLPSDEKAILQQIKQGKTVDTMHPTIDPLLNKKGILVLLEGKLQFENPLFQTYIANLSATKISSPTTEAQPSDGNDVFHFQMIDDEYAALQINNQVIPIEDFTPYERKLLIYLYEHREKPCSYHDISINVWDEDESTQVKNDELMAASKESIARVISELRKKLNDKVPGAGKRYIKNAWGLGYKLSIK